MKLTTEEEEGEDSVHDDTSDLAHSSSIKIETEATPSLSVPIGYPLSRYVHSVDGHKLSYEARELACHALNSYLQRLQGEFKAIK